VAHERSNGHQRGHGAGQHEHVGNADPDADLMRDERRSEQDPRPDQRHTEQDGPDPRRGLRRTDAGRPSHRDRRRRTQHRERDAGEGGKRRRRAL